VSAYYSFVLCNAAGVPQAEVTQAAGKQITFTRNSYHEAKLTLSHLDPAAATLETLKATGIPSLRVYRNGVLRFCGGLAPYGDAYDGSAGSGQLSLIFRSPFARVLGYGQGNGPLLLSATTFTGVEQSTIADSLLATANGFWSTPLSHGSVSFTGITRTITWPAGANVGQCIVDLSNMAGGLEFFDDCNGASGTQQGQLDIQPSIGSDRPAAKFEYGPTTLANIAELTRTNTPPVNTCFVIGANGLLVGAQDSTSQGIYGDLLQSEVRPDIQDPGLLNARASAMLRPKWSRIVQFVPDPLLAPKPFDDYGLGDTVRFLARDGSLTDGDNTTALRVNTFTIVVDDSGNEAASIPDPQAPEDAAAIQSSLALELTS
jgi:hypothetical protein